MVFILKWPQCLIFYQQAKDGGDDKPKRKLPDPDKFKKPTPPQSVATTQAAPLAKPTPIPAAAVAAAAAATAAHSEDEDQSVPSVNDSSSHMPPIQANGTRTSPGARWEN